MIKETLGLDDQYEVLVNQFLDERISHIFNSEAFFRLHAQNRAFYFQLCRLATGEVVSLVHFTETNEGFFKSPAKGTFGGFSVAEDVDLELFERFVGIVESHLVRNGAKSIEVVLPPITHSPALVAATFNILARRGFGILRHELSYDIRVGDVPLTKLMSDGNRKRCNKCLRDGFSVKVIDPEHSAAVYLAIADNRRRKGYPMTMTYEAVLQMVDLFPDRIKFFGVFRSEQLVASSICIVINPDTLYVFYWGDVDGMQQYSPIALLALTIYDFCKVNRISLLDVGTSTVNGEPNHGLIRFKRNLGFSESLKLTLGKVLTTR